MPRRRNRTQASDDGDGSAISVQEAVETSIVVDDTIIAVPKKRTSPRKRNAPSPDRTRSSPTKESTTRTDGTGRVVDCDGNPVAIGRPVNKKRRRVFLQPPSARPLKPTDRKTEHGGYAHTNKSRLKISKANAGNVPWNKGRKRSAADIAKIQVGMRAFNRSKMLENLKRWGMTEDEHSAISKNIKYMRERIRQTRRSNKDYQELIGNSGQQKEGGAQKAKTTSVDSVNAPKAVDSNGAIEVQHAASAALQEPVTATTMQAEQQPEIPQPRAGVNFFLDRITWTEPDNPCEENTSCPNGGPGGLVCCESCSLTYSKAMTQAIKDMETHQIQHAGAEVKDLLKFLKEDKGILDQASSQARKKAPSYSQRGRPVGPMRPRKAANPTRAYGNKRRSKPKVVADSEFWNVTSPLDLGNTRNRADRV